MSTTDEPGIAGLSTTEIESTMSTIKTMILVGIFVSLVAIIRTLSLVPTRH
jgi:hypothetical protein